MTGSSTIRGTIGLDVRRLELNYDTTWRGRSFRLELVGGDRTVIAHATVAGGLTPGSEAAGVRPAVGYTPSPCGREHSP